MSNMDDEKCEERKLHSPGTSVDAKDIGGDGDHICMEQVHSGSDRLSPTLPPSSSLTLNQCPNEISPPKSGVVIWTKEAVDGGSSEEKMELMEPSTVQFVNGKKEDKKSPVMLNLDCGCRTSSSRVGHLVNIILVITNMLNYMDRFTIAGLLDEVIAYYNISKSQAGLLQSSFIIFYMLLSPVFGYFGDRFNRKYIMAGSIVFWSGVTLASSFVGPNYFYVFLLMRGLVGVGEAGYSTVAPTIIADLFTKQTRSLALSMFYFAIPVGSGLGYIVGSNMAKALGGWQWALRATPGLGLICAILTILFVREPSKGAAEGAMNLSVTSWRADLQYLVKHKSFMLSSLGFTCVSFVVGALAWWGPDFLTKSILVQDEFPREPIAKKQLATQVSFIFGVITCLAGFSGVALGTGAATFLRRHTPRADPIICGFGLITGAPFLLIVIIISRYNTIASWICIYIGETLISLNWALVTDILLYVVLPTRSSTAMALQIFMCHALGDAGSPYLVGLISDEASGNSTDVTVEFVSMQYALYMTCFICVIGGGFFLGTAVYVHQDRTDANQAIKDAQLVVVGNALTEVKNGDKIDAI